jgi:hypothetical protein
MGQLSAVRAACLADLCMRQVLRGLAHHKQHLVVTWDHCMKIVGVRVVQENWNDFDSEVVGLLLQVEDLVLS